MAQFIEQFVDGQILLFDLNGENLVNDLKVKSLHSPKIMRGIKSLKARCGPNVAPGTPPDSNHHGHHEPLRGSALLLEMVEMVTSYHLDSAPNGAGLDVVAALKEKVSGLEIESESKTKMIEKLNRRINRRNDTIDKLNDAVDRMSDPSRSVMSTQNPRRRRSKTVPSVALQTVTEEQNGMAPSASPSIHHQTSSLSLQSVVATPAEPQEVSVQKVDSTENAVSAQNEDQSEDLNRYKSTEQNKSRLSSIDENEAESKQMEAVVEETAPKVECS